MLSQHLNPRALSMPLCATFQLSVTRAHYLRDRSPFITNYCEKLPVR